MQSITNEFRAILRRRIDEAQPQGLIDLVGALAAMEQEETSQVVFELRVAEPRFIKLSTQDEVLPEDASDFAAVQDNETGLVWAALNLEGRRMTQADAAIAAKNLTLLGKTDWRHASRKETLSLVDDTRRDPATDTAFFPFIKPEWYVTSTPVAGEPECAWYVSFDYGYSDWSRRGDEGFALACRGPVSPGQ